ncbi:GNAT family N-acetyltransferase [Rubellimicrobium roseum]|uniref:GNAT family N-acetyltransferase n=1 Tax=Rubellimicrobium roseum TaxID=687525 RepID=A0A5C4NDV4_9RHOB|nr:GNAT family N-acetyltransferase [Rubellimicrobium roseum]TNC68794.1 GNAT family N-acetyltransferase [Rubellimicrobium roseum]
MTAPHELPARPGPAADLAARLSALVPALETERLRLRAPTLADFPAWAEILCSPRAVHMDGPYGRDDAFTEFAATVGSWLLRGHGPWTIESRATGEVLGFVCLNMEPSDQEPELGYFLRAGAEGQGIAQEATRAARQQAWALGLPSLVSYIDPQNARSVALAERIGARRDTEAEAVLAGTVSEGALVYRHPRPEIAG